VLSTCVHENSSQIIYNTLKINVSTNCANKYLHSPSFTIGVEVDTDALEIARSNSEEVEVDERMDFILADVNNFNFRPNLQKGEKNFVSGIDTIVMNPPFGTKNKGIDMVFLQTATQIATGAVYSLHKRSTRDFVLQKIEEWGWTAEVVAELRWDIPQSYKFHKKKSVDIEVDFIRVDLSKNKLHTSTATNFQPSSIPVINSDKSEEK